ncbi:MAG: terminase family protein [Holosporales bacterium]|jgi:phage terminase large subunit-like protein|nr:terminase family protein [Holosporales bacterium]
MYDTSNMPQWREIARKEQLIPLGDWWVWLLLAGRGFGKTRTGAESVMELVNSGKYKKVAVVGKNIQEIKDVMIEGPSGLLSTTIAEKHFETMREHKPKARPPNKNDLLLTQNLMYQGADCGDGGVTKFKYYPSMNRITWENGAIAHLIGADHYEKLRGYQFDLAWLDEFAKYRNPDALWQQILFTLRLGSDPKCIITTTPKPLKILKKLLEENGVYLTKGSTFNNSDNLSARFLDTMRVTYQNTRIGRQELDGEIIMDMERAVWKRENIIYRSISPGCLSVVVIGVDPAVTTGEHSDETGIIVVGLGYDEKMYVLDDLSGKYKPPDWAKIICKAYKDFEANWIVAEVNNGGDLVREMLTTIYPNIPFKQTRAIRGKVERAEPVAMLYDAKRVFHIREFLELEEQMCNLTYDDKIKSSPDRVDALVWAISDLKDRESPHISALML